MKRSFLLLMMIFLVLVSGCTGKPSTDTTGNIGAEKEAEMPSKALFEIPAEISGNSTELNRLGVRFVQQGDWEAAETAFREVLKINPDDAAAHNNLGFCYQQRGEIAKAIEEYERALELSNDSVIVRQAHMNLAHIYMDSTVDKSIRQPDWPSKAAKHLEVLLEYEPDAAALHMWLGFAYFGATNPGGGFAELDKASQLADTKEEIWIHQQIMNFYSQINMLEKMGKEAEIMAELQGTESEGLETRDE